MTQLEDDQKTPEVQDGSRQGRRRLCVLKGCEQAFHPRHPLSRYCSAECEAAARRWRQRTANRAYRSSPQGKERRREQSRRYRTRIGQRKAAESTPPEGCEGYSYAPPEKFFCLRQARAGWAGATVGRASPGSAGRRAVTGTIRRAVADHRGAGPRKACFGVCRATIRASSTRSTAVFLDTHRYLAARPGKYLNVRSFRPHSIPNALNAASVGSA